MSNLRSYVSFTGIIRWYGFKIEVKDVCIPTAVAVSPSTPVQNGDTQTMRTTQSKIESLKNWSISTYKCTKQLMYERLGKTSRTVDFGELLPHLL